MEEGNQEKKRSKEIILITQYTPVLKQHAFT